MTKGRLDFDICEADCGSSSEDMEIIGDTWQIFDIQKKDRGFHYKSSAVVLVTWYDSR